MESHQMATVGTVELKVGGHVNELGFMRESNAAMSDAELFNRLVRHPTDTLSSRSGPFCPCLRRLVACRRSARMATCY
eukprot:SAG31_NODE_2_length_46263_cov_45.908043_5_plen_78_part_00